jgi:transcriptional regulator with GAF, ATPase, and Fis domain
VKFLRVLQSREIDRLGSKESSAVECQVVAATNIPLELLVRQKRFRRDLYYRLNICPLYIPALRQRREDLPMLIKGMLARVRRSHQLPELELSADAFEALLVYEWPGNLRELEHTLLYASLRAREVIRRQDLPAALTGQLEHYLENGSWDL